MKHLQRNIVSDGFTLLETMVAVSLLMLSIVGPLTIAQKSVKTSTYTKNRTTAYYIAQDALEFLRNIRDTNSLGGGTFAALTTTGGVYAPCIAGKCLVETTHSPTTVLSDPAIRGQAVFACSAVCQNLTYIPDPGYYGHLQSPLAVESQFRREVTIVPINVSPDVRELLVRVDVIWNEGILGGEKKISLYDELYDWQ